jgi:Amt family ammonium transporter
MAPCAEVDGDISWVLISSVLVLGMMPGLAFFEAGLLRAKNTTSILIQVFCGLAVMSMMWVCIGFTLSLTEATNGGFIGTLSNSFLIDVSFDDCYSDTKIPTALYALFQMMFAAITPLLMTGAYAERMAFRPFLCFTMLWELLVYYPVAHWIWSPNGWLANQGVQDFAGGIVIHTTAGMSALAVASYIGKRVDFASHKGEAPYSSLPLACIGASLLWAGWFGFNGGSALQAGRVALHAVMNSQIAASICSCTFLMIHVIRTGSPSLVACINGAIAGLAGITPASGYITPPAAIFLGALLAIFSSVAIYITKHRLEIDDALDVFSVHGVPGIVGAVFIGFCGNSRISGADGLLSGGGFRLLGWQVLAVVVSGAWAVLWSLLILRALERFTRIRLDHDQETVGLDQADHDEFAWGLLHAELISDANREEDLPVPQPAEVPLEQTVN